ncbi:protein-P-II uridylyltransferase, partial [Vibrio parahaemolyticus V-223/04]
ICCVWMIQTSRWYLSAKKLRVVVRKCSSTPKINQRCLLPWWRSSTVVTLTFMMHKS